MSLIHCHPLWMTAGSSPFKVAMATVQAAMLSGRYRTGALMRHWSSSKSGNCILYPTCYDEIEDIPHLLQHCPALNSVRVGLAEFTKQISLKLPPFIAHTLLQQCCPSSPSFCSFLLDCSTVAAVVSLVQDFGNEVLNYFFEVTRTWQGWFIPGFGQLYYTNT